MGILTGDEIIKEHGRGTIRIDPFNLKQVNPNSYNVTLGKEIYSVLDFIEEPSSIPVGFPVGEQDAGLVMNVRRPLDVRKPSKTAKLPFCKHNGITLSPGRLYLASTNEKVGSDNYVPMLDGRSSLGRLGLKIHITAGFGDIGFYGNWTLELETVYPLTIYPDMEIGQISFHTTQGSVNLLYSGRYQGQQGPTPSALWKDHEVPTKKDTPESNHGAGRA